MKRDERRVSRIVALLAVAAAAAPATLFAGGVRCAVRAGGAGANAPPRITIAEPAKGEQPLLVEGQVVAADGKTPAAGIVVYVYQTDSSGRYNRQRGEPPRLRGWMRTDEAGRYAYRTIRPAPYPNGREAAHVHVQLWGEETPPQWGTTLLFADDAHLKVQERERSVALGRFGFVCSPDRDAQGVEHCRHDLRLKTTGDEFEANSRHGWTSSAAATAAATAAASGSPKTSTPSGGTTDSKPSGGTTTSTPSGGRAGAAAAAGVGLVGATWGAARLRGKRRHER